MVTAGDIVGQSVNDGHFLNRMRGLHKTRLKRAIRNLEGKMVNLFGQLETKGGGKLHGLKVNLKQTQKVHTKMLKLFREEYGEEVRSIIGDYGEMTRHIKKSWRNLGDAIHFTDVDKTMLDTLREQSYDEFSRFGEQAQHRIANSMYSSVIAGASYSQLLDTVRGVLRGHADVRGRSMLAYANQHAFDSVMNFHNQVNMRKAEELGFDRFLYVGDIMETTRKFCRVRAGKVYTRRQIDSWNSMNWTGKAGPALTFRGGYNCRHHWRPVKKEWLEDGGEELLEDAMEEAMLAPEVAALKSPEITTIKARRAELAKTLSIYGKERDALKISRVGIKEKISTLSEAKAAPYKEKLSKINKELSAVKAKRVPLLAERKALKIELKEARERVKKGIVKPPVVKPPKVKEVIPTTKVGGVSPFDREVAEYRKSMSAALEKRFGKGLKELKDYDEISDANGFLHSWYMEQYGKDLGARYWQAGDKLLTGWKLESSTRRAGYLKVLSERAGLSGTTTYHNKFLDLDEKRIKGFKRVISKFEKEFKGRFHGVDMDELFRSQYALSQEMLARQYGSKRIVLYRGVNGKSPKDYLKFKTDGKAVQNSLSSWTADKKIAESFSKMGDGSGFVIESGFDLKEIIVNPQSYWGFTNEAEFIIAHKGAVTCRVSSITKSLKESVKKYEKELAEKAAKELAGKAKWVDAKDLKESSKVYKDKFGFFPTTLQYENKKKALKTLNNIGLHLDNVFKKHPGFKKILLNKKRNLKGGLEILDEAICKSSAGISLNGVKGYYIPANRYVQIAVKGSSLTDSLLIGRNSFMASGDLYGTVRHELGHHIYQEMATVTNKWYTLFGRRSDNWWSKNISGYSAVNMSEAFAECFSAFTSPKYGIGKYTTLPIEVEEFFKKLLGG